MDSSKNNTVAVDCEDKVAIIDFEVDKILDHELLASGKMKYHVSWKNYGPESNTWEPEKNVRRFEEALSVYWKSRPKPIPSKGKKQAMNDKTVPAPKKGTE